MHERNTVYSNQMTYGVGFSFLNKKYLPPEVIKSYPTAFFKLQFINVYAEVQTIIKCASA